MPSARASEQRGGNGGWFKRKDGQIVGLEFTDKPAFFKNDGAKPAPAKGAKKSDFAGWLYAVLSLRMDGQEEVVTKALQVGGKDDFEVVLDGLGLSGTVQIGKGSQWGIFMDSLQLNPKDGGDTFGEENFPEDPEGLVADYSPIIGARIMLDEVLDTSDYAKKNPRKAKGKDGKPVFKEENGKQVQVTYPLTNLVVAAYYGHAEVAEAAPVKRVAGKPAVATKPVAGKKTVAAAPTVDIAQLASGKVLAALVDHAKGKPLSINKLSVILLTKVCAGMDAEAREDVRAWALNESNLAGIEGTTWDQAKKELSLAAEDE